MSSRLRTWATRRSGLLLAIAGGGVYSLAQPPFDLFPCVLLGLALLALSLRETPSWRSAFGRAFAWAFVMQLITFRPVAAVVQNFTNLGPVLAWACLPLLAALQSVAWGAVFALVDRATRLLRASRILGFAAGIFLVHLAPAVFLFTPAGLLSPWPQLLQLADIVGEHGVSTLLAIAAACLAETFATRRPLPGVMALALLAGMGAHGAFRMKSVASREAPRPRMKVALLQPSTPPKERWDSRRFPEITRRLRNLSTLAEAQGAELTVWPEASYPYLLAHGPGPTPRDERAIVGKSVRGPILAGLVTQTPQGDRHNSATIVSERGYMQPQQDKLDLLWFGEAVPLGDVFPWLRRTFQPRGALLPGATVRLLRAGEARLAVLNCYEDSLTARGRAMAKLSPHLLVNISNDAWFLPSAEPEIHLRLSVMRAIELRRDLVRSVNLGPTSWIDASGRVRARYDAEAPGFLMAEPALYEEKPTLYARFGHLPTTTLLGGWLGFEVLARRRARRALAKA